LQLSTKTASALKWSGVAQSVRLTLQLATTFTLARLLDPADFGLLGMATIVVGFVALFREFGTSPAVIQSMRDDSLFLSTIFWLNAATGLCIAAALFAVAPLIAAFYQEPRVTNVVRVLSFSLVISGFGGLQQALLERQLSFRTLAKVEMFSTLLGAVVSIVLAAAGFGVWSLVFQALTQTLVVVLLVWSVSTWRPGLMFGWNVVRSVSGFGLNLTGFQVVNYTFRNIDNLLIGRYLGSNDLGIYNLAYRVMFFPLLTISDVIGRVMFPVYAHVQDDDARLRRYYLKAGGAIAFVSFPMMLGMMAVAGPFVSAVFGEKWTRVTVLLLILAPVGMVQSIGTTVGSIYLVKARTDTMLKWSIAASIVVTIAVAIGLQWGMVGVAIGYAIAALLLAYPGVVLPFRMIDLKFRDLALVLSKPLRNAVLMAGAMVIVRTLLPQSLRAEAVLIVCVLTGATVYWTLNLWLESDQYREIIDTLKSSGERDAS
jgi:PST family polysaccharide transporter